MGLIRIITVVVSVMLLRLAEWDHHRAPAAPRGPCDHSKSIDGETALSVW